MTQQHSMQDIATALHAPLTGDGKMRIQRITHPADWRGDGDLALAMDKKLLPLLALNNIRVAVVPEGVDLGAHQLAACIQVPRPRLAMAVLTRLFDEAPPAPTGVHTTAVVDPKAKLGARISIGPYCVIGADAVIGDDVVVRAQVTIEKAAHIGQGSLIYSGVRIGHHVKIGARAIIHFNASIGADGFSFVTPEQGSVESAKTSGRVATTNHQGYVRIASLGAVTIGDDVEIGANTSIDRGTVSDTRIGRGTKIDNQVQIGHNVQIGEDCLVCGRVAVAGSAKIANRVVLGGGVGVADYIQIGDDAVVQGFSAVGSNVPAASIVAGIPAQPRERAYENHMYINRLKSLFGQVQDLAAAITRLEPKSKSD
jgi:UDP-3-O-[3-hydroxymyristoyl] glucosamine N-acyltransferase